MSAVIVSCPHCGKELKLRDRGKLGRRAPCPGCRQTFVLTEGSSSSVAPQAKTSSAPQSAAAPSAVKARLATTAPALPPPPEKVTEAAALRKPALADAPDAAFEATIIAPQIEETLATPVVVAAPPPDAGGFPSFQDQIAFADEPGEGLARLRELKRKSARRTKFALLFGAATVLVIGGGFLAVREFGGMEDASALTVNAAPAALEIAPVETAPVPPGPQFPVVSRKADTQEVLLPHQSLDRLQLAQNRSLLDRAHPAKGQPLRLTMLPSGLNVIIHLRPAQLWSDDPAWQEVRYSLTEDVTQWIAAQLKAVCRRDPQQIEECLIGLRLGATGSEPAVSAVVRLVSDEKLSSLKEEFRGKPLNDLGGPAVYVAPPSAYLVKDARTFAIASESDAQELADFADAPNPNAAEGVDQLLQTTDDRRVFTLVAQLDDVRRHEEWLFSESTRPIFHRLLDWFGGDVEAVAWSIDVDGDTASSELSLRNRSTANPLQLAASTLARLEQLPRELQSACRVMQPPTQGFRALIGRFPAMVEAFREGTIPTVDRRSVRLTTLLPRKAAPNLALGALLAWDQSTRTDFTSPPNTLLAAAAQLASAGGALPDNVIDRLRQPLDAEFNQPLQDALAYIATSSGVAIDVDGNALKDAGFTKNMPQKFNLGRVSALDALKEIVVRNKPPVPEKRLCIVIDEGQNAVLFTTESFAKEQGREVYPLVGE